jgi:hypothetical protein
LIQLENQFAYLSATNNGAVASELEEPLAASV